MDALLLARCLVVIIYCVIIACLIINHRTKTKKIKENINYYCNITAQQIGSTVDFVESKFRDILKEEIDRCKTLGIKIKITPNYDTGDIEQFAIETRKLSRRVECSANWIELVLAIAPQWRLALTHSVGHEIGHFADIKKGILFYFRKKVNKKFFYWTNEIRCDYNGVWYTARFTDANRDEIIDAVQIKANKYNKQNRKAKYFKHPQWDFRTKMLIKYPKITKETIREIADHAGCKDEKFIQKVIKKVLC